jgi:predicted nucleic acid-binding protein
MITGIDTNILIDILEPDPVFGEFSREALKECLAQGHVVACEVVWTETATAYQHNVKGLLDSLDQMGIAFSPLSQTTALAAARAWHEYRRKGGTRRRIAADFLLGAHATMQCDQLLSRDHGFFREYFAGLAVMDPTENQPRNAIEGP